MPSSTRLVLAAAGAWCAAVFPGTGWWLAVAALLAGSVWGLLLVVDRVRGTRDRTTSRSTLVDRSGTGISLGWALSALVLVAVVALAVTLGAPDAGRARYTGEAMLLTDPMPVDGVGLRASARSEIGVLTLLGAELPPAGSTVALDTAVREEPGGYVAFLDRPPPVVRGPSLPWRVRGLVRAEFTSHVGDRHMGQGLVPGLVLGDVSRLDPGLEQAMQATSLTHVTAVSGANLTIVLVALGWTLRWIVRSRPLVVVLASTVAGAYVFLVGPEPSVLRAAAMGAVGALAVLRGGRGRAVPALALACICVLVLRPDMAHSWGFRLSVAATASLCLVAPRLVELLEDLEVPRFFAAALAVPAAAHLGVLPVLLASDLPTGHWAVLANALAAPAVTPATLVGMVGLGLSGLVVVLPAAVLEVVLTGVLELAAACAWWIARVALSISELPGIDWPWPEGAPGLALSLACVTGVACALRLEGRRSRTVAAGLVLLLVLAGVLGAFAFRERTGPWSLVVCDVGQGSAALLDTGTDAALLVDTGEEPELLEECLEAAGVREVHLLVSHFDADHVGAWEALFASTEVLDVQYPAVLGADPVLGRMREVRPALPLLPVSAGEAFTLGTLSGSYLWPEAPLPARVQPGPAAVPGTGPSGVGGELVASGAASAGESGNASSAVLRAELGELSVLLPGDIGAEEQYRLSRRVEPVDVLLAPHHGSADLDARLHVAARASLGVVSVGADNRYGHPTADGIAAFGEVPVARTDLCGSIVVDPRGRTFALGPGPGCPFETR